MAPPPAFSCALRELLLNPFFCDGRSSGKSWSSSTSPSLTSLPDADPCSLRRLTPWMHLLPLQLAMDGKVGCTCGVSSKLFTMGMCEDVW